MTKVLFSVQRQTKTISLPSFEGSQVEVLTKLNNGEQRELQMQFPNASVKGHPDQIKIQNAVIRKAILNWNFADAEGNDVQVSEEAINSLFEEDIIFLMEEITGNKISQEGSEDVKKN